MESVMPSAFSVPTCDPTSRNGACNIRTSVERNAKQMIIAAASVIAIFTIIHRRSSKCSRNGLEVSLSGTSRNLKTSFSVMRWILAAKYNDSHEHLGSPSCGQPRDRQIDSTVLRIIESRWNG